MIKLPDLEAWAIFAKVAETGSFARTAAALGIAQATVSKAISRLEARTRAVLFHRTSRRMTLTESGRVALERAARILAEGEAVEAEVSAQAAQPRGPVRLAVPMSFGLVHLPRALPAFLQRYPEISLDIAFDDRIVDLVSEGFDLALRISELDDSSLLAQRLCSLHVPLVAAPAYLERHGEPRQPADLVRHRCLVYAYSRFGDAWQFRHRRQGARTVQIGAALRVNNADALTPALLAGMGLALQPEFLIHEELAAGRLVRTMCDWETTPIGLHIVTPPQRMRPARVQVLIDYLRELFEDMPWAHQERGRKR